MKRTALIAEQFSPEERAGFEARCARFGFGLERFMSEVTTKWPIEKLLRMFELVREGKSALAAGRVVGASRSAVIGKVLRLARNGFAIRLHSNETKEGRRSATRSGRSASRAFNRFPGDPLRPAEPSRVASHGPARTAKGSDRPEFKAEPFKSRHVEIEVPPKQRRGLNDLGPDQCRWPIGDPREAGFHFCHGSKCSGLPYCETHALVAFPNLALKKREERADQEPVAANAKIATPVPETA